MLLVGLGVTEVIILLLVGLLIVAPVVGLIALALYLSRRSKNSQAMKQCSSCGYSIPLAACQFCHADLAMIPAPDEQKSAEPLRPARFS